MDAYDEGMDGVSVEDTARFPTLRSSPSGVDSKKRALQAGLVHSHTLRRDDSSGCPSVLVGMVYSHFKVCNLHSGQNCLGLAMVFSWLAPVRILFYVWSARS